jgi:hypothetical protein
MAGSETLSDLQEAVEEAKADVELAKANDDREWMISAAITLAGARIALQVARAANRLS